MADAFSLLDTITIGNQAVCDVDISSFSSYTELILELLQVKPVTDNVSFYMRTSTDGGSSFPSSNGDYRFGFLAMFSSGQGNQNSSTANAIAFLTNAGNDAEGGISGQIVVCRGWNTGVDIPQFRYDMDYYAQNDEPVRIAGAGLRYFSEDVTTLRFFFGSGNLASGTIKIIGLN